MAIVAVLTFVLADGAGRAVALPQPTRNGDDPSLVRTDNGLVRGSVLAGVKEFQGIPYAAAPKGQLRFRSPRPAKPWQGVLDGTKPGDICPQISGGRNGRQSENCLNLSVTNEVSANPQRPKPVMVHLDVGGLVSSSNVGVDFRRLVTQGDVVVVQPNVRVGPFGFLAHPAMDNPAAGGFGIQDQQAALRWVQRNIQAFGGDPDNVTVFGISGGGISTCANLMSPGAKGLLDRTIIQSGPCDLKLPGAAFAPGTPDPEFMRPLAEVENAGASLAADLGCTNPATVMACMRKKPISAFRARFRPFDVAAYGNAVLPLSPTKAFRTGRFNRVPVMVGATRDEMTFLLNPLHPKGIDEQTYRDLLSKAYGDNADAVLARYPSSRYDGSALKALSAALADSSFVLQTRQVQRALAEHVPVYAYEFADRTAPPNPAANLPPPDEVSMPYGAYHDGDSLYLFDEDEGNPSFNREQSRLARQMVGYWTTFARSGAPNGVGLPRWSKFDNAARVPHVQALTTRSQGGIRPINVGVEHNLGFWNPLHPPGP